MNTPRVTFRLPPNVRAVIWEYVKFRRGKLREGEDYNITDFIRDAIKEKIAHLERSKKSRRKRQGAVAVESYGDTFCGMCQTDNCTCLELQAAGGAS